MRYVVNVVIRVELAASVEVNAKDEEAAGDKAERLIDDGAFVVEGWRLAPRGVKAGVADLEETDQVAEVESVDEA